MTKRDASLFLLVALLILGTGVFQSWNAALAIVNMGLISAIMALGVNMQWGYAGLFNVGVIARQPQLLPWLWQALSPEAVAVHFAERLGKPIGADDVTRYPVPGIHALNLLVEHTMDGGMLASPALDPAAKAMGQMLLDFPVPVPEGLIK